MGRPDNIIELIQQIYAEDPIQSNLPSLLNKFAHFIRDYYELGQCAIWLYDPSSKLLSLRGASGSNILNLQRGFDLNDSSLTAYVFLHSEPLVLPNVPGSGDVPLELPVKGKKLRPHPNECGSAYLGVPISFGVDKLGALTFLGAGSDFEFNNTHEDVALAVADQIGLIVHELSTFFESQLLTSLKRRRIDFISEFSTQLLQCQELEEVFLLATKRTFEILSCRSTSIFMLQKDGRLARKQIWGIPESEVPQEYYERGVALTGKTLGPLNSRGKSQLENNLKASSVYLEGPVRSYVENYETAIRNHLSIEEEVSHVLTVPLVGYRRAFGVLRIVNKIDPDSKRLDENGFTESDRDWLQTISVLLSTRLTAIRQRLTMIPYLTLGDFITYNEKDFLLKIAEIVSGSNSPYAACLIHIYDDKRQVLTLGASSQNFKRLPRRKESFRLRPGEGVAGRTFVNGSPSFIRNLQEDGEGFAVPAWTKKNQFVSMVCIPIPNPHSGKNLGTISLFTLFEHEKDSLWLTYLSQFANQASILLMSIRERRDLELVNKISEQINRWEKLEDIFKQAVPEIPRILGFDNCRIIQISPNKRYVTIRGSSVRNEIDRRMPLKQPFAKSLLDDPQIMFFPNISEDPVFSSMQRFLPNVTSLVFIPIKLNKDIVYGGIVLNQVDTDYRVREGYATQASIGDPLQPINKKLCDIIANQLATAIRKNELMKQKVIESARKEVVQRILSRISADENLEKNLEFILKKLREVLDVQVGYVVLLSKHIKYIKPTYPSGFSPEQLPEMEVGTEGLVGWVYEHQEAYLYPGGPADELYVDYIDLPRIRSEIIAPLKYSGVVIGFLTVARFTNKPFDELDKSFVQTVADEAAIGIQNKRLHAAALKLSEVRFDELDSTAICNTLAKTATEIMDTPVACVWYKTANDMEPTLEMRGWFSRDGGTIKFEDRMPLSEGGVSWSVIQEIEKQLKRRRAARKKKSGKEFKIINDVKSRDSGFKHTSFITDFELESMICMPLIAGQKVFGVINTYARRKYDFLDKEIHLLQNLAMSGSHALQNALLTEQAQKTNQRILELAQFANPGQVAISFTHDAKHSMHHINMGISHLIEHLTEEVRAAPDVAKVMENLTRETEYLYRLFGGLTAHAQARKVEFKPTNLRQVVDEAVNLNRIRLEKNHIRCEVKIQPGSPADIIADVEASQIEQVLINLFSNAIDAIKLLNNGDGRIRITLSNQASGEVKILFYDNGIGIPSKYVKHIFKADFTTKETIGSGFGLATCRRIVEDIHDGSIQVRSSEQHYTTFTIRLKTNRKKKNGRPAHDE